jgi:hypothetical protein
LDVVLDVVWMLFYLDVVWFWMLFYLDVDLDVWMLFSFGCCLVLMLVGFGCCLIGCSDVIETETVKKPKKHESHSSIFRVPYSIHSSYR